MPQPRRCWPLFVICLALVGGAGGVVEEAYAAWPQYRGPNRDGLSPEKGLLKAWPEGGLTAVWRRPIGAGFSGVVAAGDRLYTLHADPNQELAAGLKTATGETIWETPMGPRFVEEFGDGPRATPVLDGDLLFALSSRGKLLALRTADGSKVWEVDLVATFGGRVPMRGFGSTPLVVGDLVIVEGGGSQGKAVQAFDRKTGETRWTSLDGGAGYSSGILATVADVPQQVFLRSGARTFVAFDRSGKVLWQHPWPAGGIAMPLFVPPNRFFASSAEDAGSVLIEVAKEGDGFTTHEIWTSRFMKNHFNSSLLVGEHIYGFDNATLRCLKVSTGEPVWLQRGFGKGSLIAADGLLFVLGDQGTLAVAEASPSGYKELGRMQALNGKSWTAPSLSDGRLYLRNLDEMVSLDVRGTGAPAGGR